MSIQKELKIIYTKKGKEITHQSGVKITETKTEIESSLNHLLWLKAHLNTQITARRADITAVEKEVNHG